MHELVTTGVILILIIVYIIGALQLPPPMRDGLPTESFYPWIITGIICVACCATLLRKKLWTVNGQIVDWRGIRKPFSTIGVIVLFLVLFKYTGYWFSTAVLSFGIAMLFEYERKNKVKALIYSAILAMIVPLFGYLFFRLGFGIRLPGGIWF